MVIEENANLANYTTIKIGGTANKVYYPENEKDVEWLYSNSPLAFEYIMGMGSNILINDKKKYNAIIRTTKLYHDLIVDEGNGLFYAGAGCPLQDLINYINNKGYGGIEYLYSVPANVGGAIYMNAGRGREYRLAIGNYIKEVIYYLDGAICKKTKEECNFDYRESFFQKTKNLLILGARFCFEKQDLGISELKVKDRLEYCRNHFDYSSPNVGSVFCEYDYGIMKKNMECNNDQVSKAVWSNKTMNWILNKSNASFDEMYKLISKSITEHICQNKKCKLEIRIWSDSDV